MFGIGDYVVYGNEGVCLVEEIRPMAFKGMDEKEYYVLKPNNKRAANVYLPCDSSLVLSRIRPVMEKDAIDAAIDRLKTKRLPWIDDRKRRTALFKAIRAEMSCEKLLLMIECIDRQRKKLESEAKKLAFSDSEALTSAENVIASEFSFVLNISAQEVRDYIKARLADKP